MSKKLVGRVGVAVEKGSSWISYQLAVNVKLAKYCTVFLRLTAQADTDSPDRAYSLQLDRCLRLTDSDFEDSVMLLARLKRAMQKEKAPRAMLYEGRAYLANCELSQFLQACEKLDLHVSRFETWDKAYDFAFEHENAPARIAEVIASQSDSAEAVAV